MSQRAAGPLLSVVVPCHNASATLSETLSAIVASDLPRELWELIVVDDASTDDTALIAARYADAVVRLPAPNRGPAYARNRGAEIARGGCLVFIDPDVAVFPDVLRRFAVSFAERPDLAAIFGTYHGTGDGAGFLATYRALVQRYTHEQSAGLVGAFWARCGAVKREAFEDAGRFDEWRFSRSQIEDVELGRRLNALGHPILLDVDVRVNTLPYTTFAGALATDFRDRGVPWARARVGTPRGRPRDRIGLGVVERLNSALLWIALVTLLIGSITADTRWVMTSGISLLPVLFVNRRLFGFLEQQRDFRFALFSVPIHLIHLLSLGAALAVGSLLRGLLGESRPDALVEAYAELGVETWPPAPARQAMPAATSAS
jgi:glycosyltransferase involved in cell wall biosynthesis